MSDPYVGEIRMFGGTFAPQNWAFCDGSLIPVAENETLYSLIGTTYGGDGETTFALPDLRGRVPIHQGTAPSGTNYVLGEKAGVENVTLTLAQLPAHTHQIQATNNAASAVAPTAAVLAAPGTLNLYDPAASPTLTQLDPTNAVTPVGGSQPHENRQPYLAVTFIISLFGIFPSQN